MGNGAIQAKLEPLSQVKEINNIFFLRKKEGPKIRKVHYIILPSLCNISIFNLLLTPIILTYYALKLKPSFIISYHIIPYAFFAAIASLLSRRPYFICQTGELIQQISSRNKALTIILKMIIKRSMKFCVPGKSSVKYWKSIGIPSSKMVILHSTVDTDKYQLSLTPNRTYDFIYVGRIAKDKRPVHLIQSFSLLVKRYPNVRLLIVGDGPLISKIKALVYHLNINNNVHFAGYHLEVLPWLYKSKFILLASEVEGLPCAIMEGMSTGLIPITTNVGNLSDVIINGNTGYLLDDKNDKKEFAEKMSVLLNKEHAEVESMRMKAREIIVERHSHKISYLKWIEILGLQSGEHL